MGSAFSIEITLDEQNAARAGHALRGKVLVRVTKPVTRQPIRLKLYGKEKTSVLVYYGDKRKIVSSERQFFAVGMNLEHPEWGATLNVGSYVIPFVVNLPPSLPSSTTLQATSKEGFRLQYKIVAFTGKTKSAVHHLSMVSSPIPDVRVPCMKQPSSFTLNAMRMFKKGTVLFGASVEDTHVGRGEFIQLHIACHNNSTTEIKRVSITLVERIQWKSHTESQFKNKPKNVHGDFENTVFELENVELPGLDRQRKSQTELYPADDAARHQSFLNNIYQSLLSDENRVDIRVPIKARDSYSGGLIRITQELRIKLCTPTAVSNPSIVIPVRIGTPPVRETRVRPAIGQRVEAVVFEPEINVSPFQSNDIPIVPAVALPDDAQYASPVTAPDESIILGGTAIAVNLQQESLDLTELVPLAPPPRVSASLDALLNELLCSLNDYDILEVHLRSEEWRNLFQSITYQEFGTILAHVNNDFDQPRVALLLAPHLNHGRGLTCKFAAQAIKSTCDWNRATMVKRLLPLCIDLAENYELLQTPLTEWERIITQADFDQVLRAG